MKSPLLTLAMLAINYATPPAGPVTTPNPDYPLRVHIFIAKASGINSDYHGFGRGDILDPAVHGFDYTFDCSQPFLNNRQPTEFYQARWKKPNEKIEILIQPIGTSKSNHCELKVALKNKPYGTYGNGPATGPTPASGSAPVTAPPSNP